MVIEAASRLRLERPFQKAQINKEPKFARYHHDNDNKGIKQQKTCNPEITSGKAEQKAGS
jgi:hypothetical protein